RPQSGSLAKRASAPRVKSDRGDAPCPCKRGFLEVDLSVVRPRTARCLPSPVCPKLPRKCIVRKEVIQHFIDPGPQRRLPDRRKPLHPPIEVARHQIGRPEQVWGFGPAAGSEDDGVLERS